MATGERFDATIVLEGGPVSLTGPSITGVARVGETLTATASSPTTGVQLSYQWLADDLPIDGATAPAFVPTADEVGKRVNVEVVASSPGRVTLTRRSAASNAVVPGTLLAPTPIIVGEPMMGSTLTAELGEWTAGTTFAHRWLLDGSAIAGAEARASCSPASTSASRSA